MKIRLEDVRLSYPNLFKVGSKYGKFGAQFRFDSEKVKTLIEDSITKVGTEAFAARWPLVKKTLSANGKLFRINDGADREYDEKYFISLHSRGRPEVRGKKGEPIVEEDDVLYPGARVDVIIDLSAYSHKEFGPVVSAKLLGVQFRGDAQRYKDTVRASDADFVEIVDDDNPI